MFLNDLFENDGNNALVIYPGRFQPFHKGHKAVYDYLVKKYGRDSVYIATSNKVEPPRSPFSFSDKVQFMTLTGVPADRIVQTVQPYKAEELTTKFDPTNTKLIFAVSQKDMEEDPRFKSWTKKDGTPAYFQPMPGDPKQMKTFDQHGYIMVVPTFPFKVLGEPMISASQIRDKFATADAATQKAIVKDLFGSYNDQVLHILQSKLSR